MFTCRFYNRPVGVVVKDVLIGAGGVGFDSRASQIGLGVANGSPSLPRFFGAALPRRYAAEMDPASRYSLGRNTTSTMKIFC